MKKLLIISTFFIYAQGFAQTCEERESKLLVSFGSFSAVTLYNTYTTLGSFADCYGAKVYSAEMLTELLANQKTMLNNLVKNMEGLKANTLKSEDDKAFSDEVVAILNGLLTEIRFMEEYMADKTPARLDSYTQQRNKDWKAIGKLLGFDK